MQNRPISQAIAVSDPAWNPSPFTERLALFREDGTPALTPQTGSDILLDGFTAEAAAPVVSTDTVNEAIAKLQARIVALEP